MKLKKIMTNDVSSVSPKDPIIDAAKIMQQRNVGCIPVCDNNKEVKGILTDRDIVIRVVAEGRNPRDLDVNKVMSTGVTLGSPDMDAEEAALRVSGEKLISKGIPAFISNVMSRLN